MNKGIFYKSVIICLLVCVIALVGCGTKPNEKTKQLIIDNLHPMLKPVSEFCFLKSSSKDTIAFEFRASNGAMYKGTLVGEKLDVSIK